MTTGRFSLARRGLVKQIALVVDFHRSVSKLVGILLLTLCSCSDDGSRHPTVAGGRPQTVSRSDFVESSTSDVAELLVSDRTDELIRGQRFVADNRSKYIKTLLERIETGGIQAKGKASCELGIIISPWVQGKEASARFCRFTTIEFPRRPVERVPDLPEADKIRQCLQTTISNLLATEEAQSANAHWRHESLRVLCETLGEVTNDETMDWAVAQLQQIKSPILAEPLIALGDSYLGIPAIFRRGGICGNSGAATIATFRLSQEQALVEACNILGTQWAQVRQMRLDQRIAFAIRSWRDHFIPKQRSYSGHYFHNGWLFQELEPLIRFGAPAVDAIRAQQAVETELEAKGVWEVAIATITGKENASLVRELLNGKDLHRELACEIIAAATSRDWLLQLDDLQTRSAKASRAIVICHRNDGIPALKRVFKHSSYNVDVVQELEMRTASGPPRGMRRYQFP